MVNCNPETVSTDYDTSDRLYFEPLDAESVLAICDRERPDGVVIQFGGQTPLKLARAIEEAGYTILGTPFDAVDLAEDRERFAGLLARARPALAGVGDGRRRRTRRSSRRARSATRCSSGPRTCSAAARCASVTRRRGARGAACSAGCSSTASSRTRSRSTSTRSATATDTYIAAVMQHVEEAGVHSGDSACVLPGAGPHARADGGDPAHRPDARPLARRRRAAQRPARGDARRRHLRARGEPARVAHGAVRQQGDRHSARRGGVPARRRGDASPTRAAEGAAAEAVEREGGGAAVRALPGQRSGARSGDALDRRGDGERRRSADRAREGRARGGPRAAASGAVFLSIRHAEKKSAVPIAATLVGLGFKLSRPRGRRRRSRRPGSRSRRCASSARQRRRADGDRPHPARALRPRDQHAGGP